MKENLMKNTKFFVIAATIITVGFMPTTVESKGITEEGPVRQIFSGAVR